MISGDWQTVSGGGAVSAQRGNTGPGDPHSAQWTECIYAVGSVSPSVFDTPILGGEVSEIEVLGLDDISAWTYSIADELGAEIANGTCPAGDVAARLGLAAAGVNERLRVTLSNAGIPEAGVRLKIRAYMVPAGKQWP